ncbi:unnamed protein product [Rhizophagus irregularis]|nr:unnamed protein product [Rhizophagus irregularis]
MGGKYKCTPFYSTSSSIQSKRTFLNSLYAALYGRLQQISSGLFDIHHNSGFVCKDFHSGNILHDKYASSFISDLECVNQQISKQLKKKEFIEYYHIVLRGQQYTRASDIYSFGIIGRISKDVPKFLEDLVIRCWNTEIENRPTAKEL